MKKLVTLAILPFMISCNGQKNSLVTSIAEAPLQLENFDFNTKLSTLLPEKTKSKEYHGYYQLKSEMMEVDTISDGAFVGSEKPIRIEYKQQSFSSRDILAKFGNEKFNAVNLVTTMDGKIMLVNALIGETDVAKTKRFVETLDKKYGVGVKSKGEFIDQSFDIYTWTLKDRIIRYSLVIDNEANTLKIEVDEENKKIMNGEKKAHYKGYIYVVKSEYKDQIFGEVGSGDFVFLENRR
ncbi:hypothetical protein [Mariniflexile sp. HMF6888]|uniref:hypothetical protein n=1 Tax=Mariniflexile sp. HMF6888 TaxID=3373086 RepID=UPI0037B736A2